MPVENMVMLIPFGAFAMVALIVLFGTREKQTQARARAEVQKELINKFSSGAELSEFLGTEGSQRLLGELETPKLSAKEKILRSTKVGVVLTVVGLGMLALLTQEPDLIIPAVILLALGVGFLLAAFISYRLSKSLGLIEEQPSGSRPERPLQA